MKRCHKCGEEKTLDHFSTDKRTTSGKKACCKQCASDYWANHSKEKKRRWHLKKNGWTPEMWESAMVIYNGICANPACDNPATDADHDHETGEARDPLCWDCNKMLGIVKDNPETLRGLAEYAEKCLNARRWING